MDTKISLKAALVVVWAATIAGAAVASENHRICAEHRHVIFQQSHTEHFERQDALRLAIVTEADVTN